MRPLSTAHQLLSWQLLFSCDSMLPVCAGLAKSSIAETAKKHGQLIGIAFYLFQACLIILDGRALRRDTRLDVVSTSCSPECTIHLPCTRH